MPDLCFWAKREVIGTAWTDLGILCPNPQVAEAPCGSHFLFKSPLLRWFLSFRFFLKHAECWRMWHASLSAGSIHNSFYVKLGRSWN